MAARRVVALAWLSLRWSEALVCPAPRRSLPRARALSVDPGALAVDLASLEGPANVVGAAASFPEEVLGSFGSVDMRIALLQAGASLFAAVFGFGDAIIAMPMLALLFDVEAVRAAPLVVSVSLFLSLANIGVDVESGVQQATGRWKTSGALLAGAVVGVPLGVRALVAVPPYAIRACVGALLLAYGAFSLQVARAAADDDADASGEGALDEASAASLALAVPFGLAAGFLGGAVAEPGPPAVVLGQSRRWTPPTMRCMLLRFFLPVQILSLVNFHDAGLITPETASQAIVALPLVGLAVAGGTQINRSVDPDDFSETLAYLVLALGVLCASTAYRDYDQARSAVQSASLLLGTTTGVS